MNKEMIHTKTMACSAIQNAAPHQDVILTVDGVPGKTRPYQQIILRMSPQQAAKFKVGKGYLLRITEHP